MAYPNELFDGLLYIINDNALQFCAAIEVLTAIIMVIGLFHEQTTRAFESKKSLTTNSSVGL